MTGILARENGATLSPKGARRIAGGAEVLAIDPGVVGAAASRPGRERLLFRSLADWDAVAAMVDWRGPVVVLLEDQFGGRNFQSAKETVWQAASLFGYLAAHSAENLTVVHVMPAVWQAAQKRRLELDTRQSIRAEGIEIAVGELFATDPVAAASVSEKLREGYASALGILLWWEGLLRCKA